MVNYESVKNFCFDVLGDFTNPSNIDIEERADKFNVIVLRTGGIPKDVIRDEWQQQIAGTEFEGKATLYL